MADTDVLPSDQIPTELTVFVERFADEGVPVRAMARSFKYPAEAVREAVEAGIYHGRIVQMPKDDWPVGERRDDRVQQFARATRMNDENLIQSIVRVFKITKLQAAFLSALLNRNEVSKITMHQIIQSRRPPHKEETDIKMVDVVICNLRKGMDPFNFTIYTMWGCGYYMKPVERREILKMVNSHGLDTEATDAPAEEEGSTEGD